MDVLAGSWLETGPSGCECLSPSRVGTRVDLGRAMWSPSRWCVSDPPSDVPLWTANMSLFGMTASGMQSWMHTWLLGPEGLDLLARRMLLVYVPGAFKWAEYGLSAIGDAVDDASYEDGPGDASDYSAWFLDRMVAGGGHQLTMQAGVYGEDFPYSVPDAWDDDISLIDLPMRAIQAGQH